MPTKTLPFRALLGAAVLALLVAFAAPAVAQEALKIAILDTEQILTTSATGKAALEELTALRDQKQTEGQALQDELEALQNRLREGRLSLSQDKIIEMEKQLEDKAIALRRFQDDANRDLTKKREEILARVDAKVMPVINAFGEEQGYDLIFRKFESGLIYADEAIDITQQVIQRLDSGN